ncbi:SDR family oxidoreductase, partial [Candidatus Poribacteria bacterium]|nr:SDR family oxidoreductase [Candidatus Poribacteria bacterium]
ATKTGVVGITKSLAIEWGAHGITVNCIAPGWFETDLNRALFRQPAWHSELIDRLPLGRSGEGEDLAEVAAFLASDAASYITGQVLTVDGGFLAGWKARLVP